MDINKKIVITGAAGFISSCLIAALNELGIENIVMVDDFSIVKKTPNFIDRNYVSKVHRDQLMEWAELHAVEIEIIIHLGARTDTTLDNPKVFKLLNLDYSKAIFEFCTDHKIPLIYASSAATYGDGSFGYDDVMSLETLSKLKPLNQYAESKQDFDKWVLSQSNTPPQWIGLKFFNVYGPNEYHKERMASVVYHAYKQVIKGRSVSLFRSHHKDYEDGGQMRDFIYVKDVVKVILWFMNNNKAPSGIYNLGTGKARSFLELIHSLFTAISHNPGITFIDTPEDIREKYQYFTEAKMGKLRAAGYSEDFFTLEAGVKDYAQNYLQAEKIW